MYTSTFKYFKLINLPLFKNIDKPCINNVFFWFPSIVSKTYDINVNIIIVLLNTFLLRIYLTYLGPHPFHFT